MALVFAVFDQDSLVQAMKRIWDKLAPSAMFTAAGNISKANNEDFLGAVDMVRWNKKAQDAIAVSHPGGDFGYSGATEIKPNDKTAGSNNKPNVAANGDITGWTPSSDKIRVPAGFEALRGDNVQYADQIPPFDITLTFGNEYGQCAFQKLYDVDILNESSGVSVDTIVLERQMTYIARRLSPLVKGVYSRDKGGDVKGLPVYASK